MEKAISLMFSGGIDSSYAAIELAKEYDIVYLVTYSNGYGHFQIKRAKKRFNELNKRFPGKFRFFYSSIKNIFEEILINGIDNDSKKYSSAFIWCMGCKLSMHSQTIIFNKKKGIKFAADGSSQDTNELVEQSSFALSLISDLYEKNGISFKTPVYDINRKDKRRESRNRGFSLGIKIMDRHLGIQPKCIPGELYYSPFLIMGKQPYHQVKEIGRFYKEKLPLLNKVIKECSE